MTTINELLSGAKTAANGLTVAVISAQPVKAQKLKDGSTKQLQEIVVSDGSGQIALSVWEPAMTFQVGQQLSISSVYVKDYQGKKTMLISKGGVISLAGTVSPSQPQPAHPAVQQPAAFTKTSSPEYISDEEIINKIIEKKGLDTNIIDAMVDKQIKELSGLITKSDALVLICKSLGIEGEIRKPKPKTDADRDTAFVDMSYEQLKIELKTAEPVVKGLIEKVIMHKQNMEVLQGIMKQMSIANKFKELELKLMAEINKSKEQYEITRKEVIGEIPSELPKEITDKVEKKSKKTAKKDDVKEEPKKDENAPEPPFDENGNPI